MIDQESNLINGLQGSYALYFINSQLHSAKKFQSNSLPRASAEI